MKIEVDDSMLSAVDRLGVAACRLNCWEWDEIIGPKPEGYDQLPRYIPERPFRIRKGLSKHDYTKPAIKAIESIIGKANISRCWWKYVLGRDETEWLKWYVNEHVKSHHTKNQLFDG